MHIEILTWAEIQALPEFHDDKIDVNSTYWGRETDTEFQSLRPDRIVELFYDTPDEDGDYECADFLYPPCVIKRFIPDNEMYGTHRILKRNPHGIPI